jgi:hypothetical protein
MVDLCEDAVGTLRYKTRLNMVASKTKRFINTLETWFLVYVLSLATVVEVSRASIL